MTKNNLIFLEKGKECCGCSACSAICPTNAVKMSLDDMGFYYPIIDKKLCIACMKCKNVCPMNNKVLRSRNEKS